ncbi:hypothetical protein F441_02386 [Phytophthora nicotianae CJ01A1]|uniref:Transmembrane protein n=6 Tax=Phytophthora nicotianae TaxID=4792 RepID=W2QPB8_PHYN3|nr:hypothetical protein PPTG_07256 [Phytophthora nicotianae INRA-310]ETI54842.1 hypothetical protein F443_02435 [Phytophthora nicotianae P1569]ETK94674.1 hypothetical protein L915_02319 [Phytophthora nicotianae]ETO83605.1 hypothetical protein F444_02419 [Phytophthora nicotianae P1976]ETP24679.1 hypothetical protein F441_02386 [Phytophthora nicotianae CJ01A1]ETP52616.1 hypothetical protein F442_02403 [Phytophthora nicotianae P10297]KUF84252.1 hypothetical protein AM587_10004654 [Phytophthora n
MRMRSSSSILAVSLMLVMCLLVLHFPVKANANSLRHGAVPNHIITPSSPVVIPHKVESDKAIPVKRQRTVQDELSQVFAAAPAVSSSTKGRKGTGDACIGPVCGLGLFFASIGLTFVACVVVIYIADKRYDYVQNSRRRRDKYYDSMRKRRPSNSHLDFRRNCTSTVMRRRAAQ